MWGSDRLQLHGICNCRMAYRKVVEALSNYERSYLSRFRNHGCVDLIGSNMVEKENVPLPPGLVWGKEWGENDVIYCVWDAFR